VGKKKDDLCREFGLENFTIQTIWKNRTKKISPFDQNASRTLQFLSLNEVTAIRCCLRGLNKREGTMYHERSSSHDHFCSS